MRFNLRFHGRRKGSIGITYSISINVEAKDKMSAARKVYKTHEYVVGDIRVLQIEDDAPLSVADYSEDWDLRAIELGTNPETLRKHNQAAYDVLPECYQNDSSLRFFVDVNENLCAEHTLHKETYIFANGQWLRGE